MLVLELPFNTVDHRGERQLLLDKQSENKKLFFVFFALFTPPLLFFFYSFNVSILNGIQCIHKQHTMTLNIQYNSVWSDFFVICCYLSY